MTTADECQAFRESASDYLDRVVPGEIRVVLNQHLDACRQCARFLGEVRLTVRVLGQLRVESATVQSEREALRAFQGLSRSVNSRRRVGSRLRALGLWRDLSSGSQDERLERVSNESELQTVGLCRLLLAKAEETVSINPRVALRRAELSVHIAERLPNGKEKWCLNSDCWSALAVTRAAVSDLTGAREALVRAEESFDRSNRAEMSRGRLLTAKAWISSNLGRLAESEAAYLTARRIFETLGERLRAVAVMINLSCIYAMGGRYDEAIRTLTEALSLMDERKDPARVLLAVQNNLALSYCELEQEAEALKLLPGMEVLVREVGGDAPTHLRWLKGTIARVQGDWKNALRIFFEIREHFRQRGEFLHYAESSLDALRVYLAMGDWSAVGRLAVDTSRACRAMTSDPDLLGALGLLEEQAVKQSLDQIKVRAVRALIGRRLRQAISQ